MKKNLLLIFWIIPLLVFGEGGSITPNRYNDSLIGGGSMGTPGAMGPPGPAGPIGPMGPTGLSGAPFTSYGQLSVSSSQSIGFITSDEWVAIPFNTFNPSFNVDGSTSPPATITILEDGTYQMTISLYFSSEDSDEDTFNQTTYTLGTQINAGTVVPNAAVYASESGQFSLSYNALIEFSENDTIAFYIKSSVVMAPPFDNVVMALNGNANVVQLSQ